MRLKLRATLYVLERPPGAKTAVRRMIQYAVEGLPSNRRALIARRQERWQMLRQEDGVVGCWEGDYPTADVALSAVEAQAFLDVAAAHVSVAEADRLVFGLLRSGLEN